MRIPRKKKKQIPLGLYCYKQTSGWKVFPDGTTGFSIERCPFYGWIKYKDIPKKDLPDWIDDEFLDEFGEREMPWCRLVKTDIMDQCKSCGERYGKDYR
jgi:hypothetical protein